MSFIVPLLYFLMITGSFVIIFKKSFTKCLPLTFMISAFTLFFSQIIFKTFIIGIVLNIILALMFIPLLFINKNKINDIKKLYLSNGLIVFILIYISIFIFDLYREFSMWDEFSHWGVMIKEMFRLDSFYSVSNSTLMVHKDYPPILQLYELFYCKISGGYSEYSLIKSLHLFEFSLLISAFIKEDKINFKAIIKCLACLLCVYLLFLLFDNHNVINTIYTDYFVSILCIYLIWNIFINRNITSIFNIFLLTTGLSFLLLTKQIGLPLYLMILFFYVINLPFKNMKTDKPVLKIITIIISMIIPLLFYTGWNNYVDSLNIDRQFDIKNISYNELEDYQKETFNNYIKATTSKNLTTSKIKLSYSFLTVFVFITLLILTYLLKNKTGVFKLLNINFTLTIGSIGYLLVMMFLYVFCFGNIEGPTLSSFNRYMPTFILISLTIIFIIMTYYFKERIIIVCLVGLLVINYNNYRKLIPALKKDVMSLYEKCANDIKVKDNSKVFIIANDTEGEFNYRIKYYANNITTNNGYINLKEYSDLDIKEITKDYDYIYIAVASDEFINKHQDLFNNKLMLYGLYERKSIQ